MKTRSNSGRLVAQLRKTIGKSQAQFAAMIGVSKHTIISVENARNKLSKKLARRIQMATGAEILNGNITFEPVFRGPGEPNPEAFRFAQSRWYGTGKHDNLYTRQDFEQWRANFYPTNDEAARKLFGKIKVWVECIFRAAAKPGIAGNWDRLPAVYQSMVEWLNEARRNFKLETEIDEILEAETHFVSEYAGDALALRNSDRPDLLKDLLALYGYDYNEVMRFSKKSKPSEWVILQAELRRAWDPFDNSEIVPCTTRKLPNPEIKLEDAWSFTNRIGGLSQAHLVHNIAQLPVKQLPRQRPARS